MDMPLNDTPRIPNPRRRRRTKMQIFKEAYLPTIILAVTVVMIIVFIIGAAVSGKDPQPSLPSGSTDNPGTSSTQKPGTTEKPTDSTDKPTSPTDSTPGSTGPQPPSDELINEAHAILKQANKLAASHDYEGAIAVLESFSGDMNIFVDLKHAHQEYTAILENMVAWNAGDVVNLSFQLLIADPDRAFVDPEYKNSYKNNFITVHEFSAILQQLYDNGYVLVSLDDFYTQVYNTSSGRYIYKENQLLLPAGKKPIMLTETNANYYTYMVDSNSDGKPDAGADGFACRLAFDGTNFYNELVNADGSVSTGAYDMVPILENFIQAHPDFSYKGARAIVAFSGYDGVLGYRINSPILSADELKAERDGAAATVEALQNAGYDLACYTYNNYNYSMLTPSRVQEDIQNWLEQIAPWIGNLDILVYAKDADIAGEESYSGNSKFNVLHNAGFRFFLGVSTSPWNQVDDQYVRHNRLSLSGSNLLNNPELFEGLFDPATVLDSARP